MVKIAIVEDEESYIKELADYLKKYQETAEEEFSITVYRNGAGIASCKESQFDIILMDIQMEVMDGMEAAKEIRKTDGEVVIIFITNMAGYAIEGYGVGATDFIVKPISYLVFSQKLTRALSRVNKTKRTYITIPVRGGVFRLDISDIHYIESQKHNLIFHTGRESYTTILTMKSIEEQLTGFGFSRGNHWYLINLRHVDEIRDKCILIKGKKLPLSRTRADAFMKDMVRYWGEM